MIRVETPEEFLDFNVNGWVVHETGVLALCMRDAITQPIAVFAPGKWLAAYGKPIPGNEKEWAEAERDIKNGSR